MSQGPLCPNLTKKGQAEVSQMANRNLSRVILLGGLSVNLNHLKTNEQHNAQISQVLKEVEALKEQSCIQPNAESDEPGEKISRLKSAAFNFMPEC